MNTDNKSPAMHRKLKNRHMQMIALGAAVGTGLFYGSAPTIQLVGPGIILSYLLTGIFIFFVMRMLGEMTVREPVSASFSHFAGKYWHPFMGYLSGWNYWTLYMLAGMAELAAIAVYMNYWFPSLPQWLSTLICIVIITGINLSTVRAYGEAEFWASFIKIGAIVAMILFGFYLIFATMGAFPQNFSNLWTNGGFFPNGGWGFLCSLAIVMFSFGGVELIGITAGEAENPEKSLPRAINELLLRILIFYVGTMVVLMTLAPWNKVGMEASPFVQIFDSVGVHAAAGILNFVCLTAVMSVYNSGLYANSRMLYSLAKQGNAPAYLGRLNKRGVPVGGVITSAIIIAIAVVVVFVWPDFAFNYLMSIATIAAAINWIMIMLTEIKFRRVVAAGDGPNDLKGLKGQEALDKLAFKLPFAKVTPYLVIAFMLLVVVLMCFSASYRIAVIAGVIWLAVLFAAYQLTQVGRKQADASAADAE